MVLTEVEKVLGSVAAQLMNGEEVLLEDQKIPVKRVGSGRLRMAEFRLNSGCLRRLSRIERSPAGGGS